MSKNRGILNRYVGLRHRALELLDQGHRQTEISKMLNVAQSTVSDWKRLRKVRGEEALGYPKVGGSKPRLDYTHYPKLDELLSQGAEAHGFEGEYWTRARVQKVIKDHFGIEYSQRTLSDVLKRLGYSRQKPDRVDYRQKPEAVRWWKEERLPELKKKVGTSGK